MPFETYSSPEQEPLTCLEGSILSLLQENDPTLEKCPRINIDFLLGAHNDETDAQKVIDYFETKNYDIISFERNPSSLDFFYAVSQGNDLPTQEIDPRTLETVNHEQRILLSSFVNKLIGKGGYYRNKKIPLFSIDIDREELLQEKRETLGMKSDSLLQESMVAFELCDRNYKRIRDILKKGYYNPEQLSSEFSSFFTENYFDIFSDQWILHETRLKQEIVIERDKKVLKHLATRIARAIEKYSLTKKESLTIGIQFGAGHTPMAKEIQKTLHERTSLHSTLANNFFVEAYNTFTYELLTRGHISLETQREYQRVDALLNMSFLTGVLDPLCSTDFNPNILGADYSSIKKLFTETQQAYLEKEKTGKSHHEILTRVRDYLLEKNIVSL
jgi:hypothetical protein